MTRLAAGLLAALVLWASPGAAGAQVQVRDAWVRATVPGQSTAGAYMTITSGKGGALVAARSPSSASAEIHEMRMEGDVMRMRALRRLELPPGKAVELKPGGHHVMLMNISAPLKKGQTVPLTLEVEGPDRSRQTIEVVAEVREPAAGARGHAGNGHRAH